MYRLAVAAAVAATSAQAQTLEPSVWVDSLRRLEAEYTRLQDSLLRRDMAAVEIARSGDLVIYASPFLEESARRALELVARRRQDWFGRRPVGFRLVARVSAPYEWTSGRPGRAAATVMLVGLPDTDQAHRTLVPVPREALQDGDRLAGALLRAISSHPGIGPDSSLVAWLGTALATDQDPEERRREAMYALVTGIGPSHQGCVAGAIDACARLMSLEAAPIDSPGSRLPISARGDLLLSILEWSDDEAWGRLSAAGEASVIERLEAAGGAPMDSLLSKWRRETLALLPDSAPLPGRLAAAALAWTALLLASSLGLSRWV